MNIRESLVRLIAVSSSCVAFNALAAETAPAPAPVVPTYADVEPIVAAACLSCHSADTGFGDIVIDTEAKLKEVSKLALDAIESGSMPAGDDTFKDTEDGKLLISYLQSLQTPVPPVPPTPPAPLPPTYADVAALLKASCVSCHGASAARGGVRLDTEANAIKYARSSAGILGAGRMPPRSPGYVQTAEGKLLLSWFKNPLPTPAPKPVVAAE